MSSRLGSSAPATAAFVNVERIQNTSKTTLEPSFLKREIPEPKAPFNPPYTLRFEMSNLSLVFEVKNLLNSVNSPTPPNPKTSFVDFLTVNILYEWLKLLPFFKKLDTFCINIVKLPETK